MEDILTALFCIVMTGGVIFYLYLRIEGYTIIEFLEHRQEDKIKMANAERNAEQERLQIQQMRIAAQKQEKEDSQFQTQMIRRVLESQIVEEYKTAAMRRLDMDPTPASLNAKRLELRKKYRDAVEEGDVNKETEALSELYRYGLLVVYCYGGYEGGKSVLGWQYDNALNGLWSNDVEHIFSMIEYKKDGRIKGCRFLSERDWQHFEKRWGKVNGEVDLKNLVGDYPGLHMHEGPLLNG